MLCKKEQEEDVFLKHYTNSETFTQEIDWMLMMNTNVQFVISRNWSMIKTECSLKEKRNNVNIMLPSGLMI